MPRVHGESTCSSKAHNRQYTTKPLQNLSIAELEMLKPARDLLSSPSGYTDVAVNAFDSTRFISVLASENRYYVYTRVQPERG
jgi:hypothetical protein